MNRYADYRLQRRSFEPGRRIRILPQSCRAASSVQKAVGSIRVANSRQRKTRKLREVPLSHLCKSNFRSPCHVGRQADLHSWILLEERRARTLRFPFCVNCEGLTRQTSYYVCAYIFLTLWDEGRLGGIRCHVSLLNEYLIESALKGRVYSKGARSLKLMKDTIKLAY